MKHSHGGLGRIMVAGLGCLFLATAAFGQLGKGVITGTVADPSGAVVPGATATLTNQATRVERTAQTNSSGIYRFDFTDVGAYTLRINLRGFAQYEICDLVVTVGQTVTKNVQLELARAGTQTVSVEAGAPQLVDTADAQISGLVGRANIQNLPLGIRDATAFVDLMPGAVPDAFNGSTRGAAVNGMRGGMGNFMIDGTDNNDYGQGGRSTAFRTCRVVCPSQCMTAPLTRMAMGSSTTEASFWARAISRVLSTITTALRTAT